MHNIMKSIENQYGYFLCHVASKNTYHTNKN